MDIYKLKWTELERKIFSYLCIYAGERFSQRDLAKKLNVSPTAISYSIKNLTKKGLVNVENLKSIRLVSFNRNNEESINLKRVENLKNIYQTEMVKYLEKKLAGATIILFGSYSLGEDTIKSDIDIAIIGRKEKEIETENYEKILNRKININFYDSWKKINKNLKNNILNGILLKGSIEL